MKFLVGVLWWGVEDCLELFMFFIEINKGFDLYFIFLCMNEFNIDNYYYFIFKDFVFFVI